MVSTEVCSRRELRHVRTVMAVPNASYGCLIAQNARYFQSGHVHLLY